MAAACDAKVVCVCTVFMAIVGVLTLGASIIIFLSTSPGVMIVGVDEILEYCETTVLKGPNCTSAAPASTGNSNFVVLTMIVMKRDYTKVTELSFEHFSIDIQDQPDSAFFRPCATAPCQNGLTYSEYDGYYHLFLRREEENEPWLEGTYEGTATVRKNFDLHGWREGRLLGGSEGKATFSFSVRDQIPLPTAAPPLPSKAPQTQQPSPPQPAASPRPTPPRPRPPPPPPSPRPPSPPSPPTPTARPTPTPRTRCANLFVGRKCGRSGCILSVLQELHHDDHRVRCHV